MNQRGQNNRRYRFSEELRAELRRAYAGNKPHVTRGLDQLERRTGWPRHAFKYEASRLGIETSDHRRAWTAEEMAYLEEAVGLVSMRRIADRLHRTVSSVESKAEKLLLSRRAKEGYCMADLAAVFGEHPRKVKGWMERGLLGKVHRSECADGMRVSGDNVKRFVMQHHNEYDFRRVDQSWIKMMIFEDGNGAERWL